MNCLSSLSSDHAHSKYDYRYYNGKRHTTSTSATPPPTTDAATDTATDTAATTTENSSSNIKFSS